MAVRAFITGLAGLEISANERAFLREAEPWGLIIFKRNIDTPAQVSALISSFRDMVGREAPVLVDQEGGRVNRLKPVYGFPESVSHEELGRLNQLPETYRRAEIIA